MPIQLTHVLDENTPEDGVRLLSLLLRLMPETKVQQRVITIGRVPLNRARSASRRSAVAGEGRLSNVESTRISRPFGSPLGSMLELRQTLQHQEPDVVHAFSAAAAAAVGTLRSTFGGPPVVITISDPTDAGFASKWWRSARDLAGAADALCPSKIIQRKLVESGIPMDATAVIRPGVDFGDIRRAKEAIKRPDLGLPLRGKVFTTASPPSREGGQYYAVWAMAILHQIWPDARLLIPGTSREQDRLRRLIENIYCPQAFILTEDRYTPAELLAVSDAMLVPAIEDIPTAALAWAMAASVPIIGSAVPAVAELIADRHNGFLCKPGQPRTLAIRIRTVFDAPDQLRQCTEVARGQAYDVFRAQRCVEEYLKVFQNLATGQRAVANVQDAAVDT